ncbi:MAG: TspO/MBR family protein [Fluviicola sp.]
MWRFILFLILNFGALFLGSLLMGNPADNTWYQQQDLAPWTPPGWVFGAAWFTIMLLFAIFLSKVLRKTSRKTEFWTLLSIHYVLNIAWNPLFFKWHWVGTALLVLALLWIVVLLLWVRFRKAAGWTGWLLLPYLVWLVLAFSLNAFVV